MLAEFPAPWRDMVAISWYTGGLRLSDVCLMTWESVNLKAGYISLREKKTKKERCIPICAALREVLEARHKITKNDKYVFPDKAHFYLSSSAGYSCAGFTFGAGFFLLLSSNADEKFHLLSPQKQNFLPFQKEFA